LYTFQWQKEQKHNVVLLLGKLLVQEKEMQENELKEPQRGEGMQVVLGEELHEELAGEQLQEELAGEELQEELAGEELAVEELQEELAIDLQEDVRQYDAKRPPIFYSNFAKSL